MRSAGRSIRGLVSSALGSRSRSCEHLGAGAHDGSDLKAAELIFGELTANVAQHAGGRIDVALEWRDGIAVLHVIDRGEGFASRTRSGGGPV